MRWSGRAGTQGEIEPEWREDLVSQPLTRVWCGAVPDGLKILGFLHSLGRQETANSPEEQPVPDE